jgi:PIN domain nuclease of toxin-antitoxin system
MSEFLLDTHIFVWLKTGERTLLPQVAAAMADPANTVVVSLASAWELCIKAATGKLGGDASRLIGSETQFERILSESGLDLLPILRSHVFALRQLPLHNRDPFDRIIVAQAISEGMTLVTVDRHLEAYAGLDMIIGA